MSNIYGYAPEPNAFEFAPPYLPMSTAMPMQTAHASQPSRAPAARPARQRNPSETSDPGLISPQSTSSRSPDSPDSVGSPPSGIPGVVMPYSAGEAGAAVAVNIRRSSDAFDDASGSLPPRGPFGKPRVSLALLLEASAAAAEAEQKAEQQPPPDSADQLTRLMSYSETDRFITESIHRVQMLPRNQRRLELKPLDRRAFNLAQTDPQWTRMAQIRADPGLLSECRRVVRGTQGCGRDCDAKFTNLVEFATHVDASHDVNFRPYLCPKERCPWRIIGFHERSECTRHIRTKHHQAMYGCGINGCLKVYNRSDAFRRHVRQAHANPESRFNRMSHRPPASYPDEDDTTDSTDGEEHDTTP